MQQYLWPGGAPASMGQSLYENMPMSNMAGNTAGAAGGMAGGLMGLLTGNPIAGYIASALLSNLAGSLFQSQSPYEKAIKSQLGYSQGILPMLSQEAQGIPSLATKNAMQSVSQEVNRLQQALAATAQRNAPAKTTVGRSEQVGQQRYQQAKTQAYGNILAQQQANARAALLGLSGQAMQGQLGLEMQDRADRQSTLANLGTVMAQYKQYKEMPDFMKMFKPYIDLLYKQLGVTNEEKPILPTPTQQGTPYYPQPRQYQSGGAYYG